MMSAMPTTITMADRCLLGDEQQDNHTQHTAIGNESLDPPDRTGIDGHPVGIEDYKGELGDLRGRKS